MLNSIKLFACLIALGCPCEIKIGQRTDYMSAVYKDKNSKAKIHAKFD